MSYQVSQQQRLKNLLNEQQAALQPGVHYHALPSPRLASNQRGLVGPESPLNSHILRRPETSPADARMRTISGHHSPRDALPDLRAKGMREEAIRAANEGRITNDEAVRRIDGYNGNGIIISPVSPNTSRFNGASSAVDRATFFNAAANQVNAPSPSIKTSRPSTAASNNNNNNNNNNSNRNNNIITTATATTTTASVTYAAPSRAIDFSPAAVKSPNFVIPTRPPLDRQDLPPAKNLPTATTNAAVGRNSSQAMETAKTANPFYVAHSPPPLDMKSGDPIVDQNNNNNNNNNDDLMTQTTPAATASDQHQQLRPSSAASAASNSSYKTSEYLSNSKAAEFHESQREVLNLQLRGVSAHSLKMRRAVVDDVVEPVNFAAHDAVDLCNGCTAALKSYEENYDCTYQVPTPELPRLADELRLKTTWLELQRLLALPGVDAATIRQVLTDLSAPIEDDPREDAMRTLSQSRLEMCKRQLGRLDAVAGLSLADSALRMYELLHTDLLTGPRDLLAADEQSLVQMQKDVEKLYIKRTSLLEEVQRSTNRTAPLMADGPLSGVGAGSLTPGNNLISPGSASRQISALMAAEGQDKESDEIRNEVQRQILESSPGRARVNTVEALSPPRRGIVTIEGRDVAVPQDTEDDTDGRKLAVVENTQRREVNISREVLNRRTNRCNALLDFVDGIRAFVAEATEQQKLGNELNEQNLKYIAKIILDASDDINKISSTIQTERDVDSQAQQKFALEQRDAHSTLARLTQEEGALWQKIRELTEQAIAVGKSRDELHEERMKETESEARRHKIHRQRMERMTQLNIQVSRMKKQMAKYEEASQISDNFHKTFVAESLVPKIQQEEEIVTLRGTEALAFAGAFKNFIFSAEDLLARLEIRTKALLQRQRAAGFDESVAHDSLDIAGRDSYLTEMTRLANMIQEADQKKEEVSDWIREGRENARTFMPIAATARDAAKHQAAVRRAIQEREVYEDASPSASARNRSLLIGSPSSASVNNNNNNNNYSSNNHNNGASSLLRRPMSGSVTRATLQKAEEMADRVQEEDFTAHHSARHAALRDLDSVEDRLHRQTQSAEDQVESLRSEIRRVRKENEAQLKQFSQSSK